MPLISDLCRLCSQKKKIRVNLISEDYQNNSIIQKINSCLSLKIPVTIDDPLPKSICFDCQRHLEMCNSFRNKCHRAEARLLKMFNSPKFKIKEELLEESCNEEDQIPNSSELIPAPGSLKSEIVEDDVSKSNADFIRILSDEIVQQPQFAEIKKLPQIEVIDDARLRELIDQTSYLPPKIEFISTEVKPNITDCKYLVEIDDNNDDDDDYLRGIPDECFTLREGETCDIDLEEMDAILKKKQIPNYRFKCTSCTKTFKFFKNMVKHRKACQQQQLDPFQCNDCPKKYFSSLITLKAHIKKIHVQEGNYACELCGEYFRTRTIRKLHLKTIHNVDIVKCKICFQTFRDRNEHKKHLSKHQCELRPHECPKCHKRFRFQSILKSHLDAHDKIFLCSECGQKFSTHRILLDHLNLHSGKRPYVCQLCFASFSQAGSLRRHKEVHKTTKPVCTTCDKTFTTMRLFQQHMRIHTGERPFRCVLCFRSFRSQSDLCNHKKIHEEKQFVCDKCEVRFTRRSHLRRHTMRHTGARHRCPAPLCGKAYTQRQTLSQHFAKNHPHLALNRRIGGHKKDFLPIIKDGDVHYTFSIGSKQHLMSTLFFTN